MLALVMKYVTATMHSLYEAFVRVEKCGPSKSLSLEAFFPCFKKLCPLDVPFLVNKLFVNVDCRLL